MPSYTVVTKLFLKQAHLPEIKVHAYFAPVTPPPSVHGSGQRLCRCCIILWQWRARGGHLCLQVLLLWGCVLKMSFEEEEDWKEEEEEEEKKVEGTWIVEGERRGWTHPLLLIHWSPLIPDQLNPPLVSPLVHQSVLQRRNVEERILSLSFSCLCFSLFLSENKTDS